MTVACSRVSSMSVRAVITSYALVGPQGRTQNSVLVGAARCLPVPVPFCSKTPGHAGGAGTHTVPTLFIPRREIPRSRACGRVSGARARIPRGWRVRPRMWHVRLIARGTHCTGYWAENRTERLKEKQRLTSCDGAQELHATWLLAMYTGRLRGDRRGAREVGW